MNLLKVIFWSAVPIVEQRAAIISATLITILSLTIPAVLGY
ncbi:hypothetical protein [Haloimpatiens massiliensis]|nr:hypothetical protein [Haloimpatiens massiliensis]